MTAPTQAGLTYVGELSLGDNGLIATEGWNAAGTSLSWMVDNETPGLWHYAYTLTVPDVKKSPAVSHMIIEVSDGDPGPAFTSTNLFSPASDPADWMGPIEIQTHSPGSGNPFMPEAMYGVKFEAADDAEARTLMLEFYSDRVPVWGDFYAKGGNDSSVFNAGFAAPDPLNAPADGSYLYHVLVPDTTTVLTPAPGAILLAGFGAGLFGWLRRRRMM